MNLQFNLVGDDEYLSKVQNKMFHCNSVNEYFTEYLKGSASLISKDKKGLLRCMLICKG